VYPVTSSYQDAIYASSRQFKAKTIFEIIDVDAYSDDTVTVTAEEEFSKKAQITNLVRQMSAKYATFEDNYWLLDGSFSLPPKASESGYEVGWWSDALSGVGGTFSVSQVVTIDFMKNHSSAGISIIFDQATNEYASDFTIQAYNSVGGLIDSISVTGNTDALYIWDNGISNYRQIKITITKWKSANRRARITEVDFGIIMEYTGDEIIKLNVLEEVDTVSNKVSSNEVSLTLDNQNKDFNILNPTGIYPYLQRKQKIYPYYGLAITDGSIEYIPMGIYYLTEWKSDEGTLTASFTARDILDLISQDEFPGASYTTKTLSYIANDVLTTAGLASSEFNIDTALASITVTGTLDKANYRDTLQYIAMAGKAVVYADRYGVLQIKQLSGIVLDETIGFNSVYAAPSIKLDKLINTIIFDIGGGSTRTYTDPSKPADESVLAVKITNPLINTNARGDDVGAWIITEYNKRFLYTINWRQNPAYEAGNIVTVEDEFGENKTVRITKSDFQFAGYLAGKTEGRAG
jgi:hypothetical protein